METKGVGLEGDTGLSRNQAVINWGGYLVWNLATQFRGEDQELKVIGIDLDHVQIIQLHHGWGQQASLQAQARHCW